MKRAAILGLFASISIFTSHTYAWDEDTCGSSAAPRDSTDPTCASTAPLDGRHQTLVFDHSTAHWEMTYLMARCVGISSDTATRIAAADEATDMSSPACGSSPPNSVDAGADYAGQFYWEGYACGYELDPDPNVQNASAVPFFNGTLRWSRTDRCRSVRTGLSTLHGHSEFFHYPYYRTSNTTNNLSTLEAWAFGRSSSLTDPSDNNCDLANGATTNACSNTSPLSLNQFSGSGNVCRWTNWSTDWRMPASSSNTTDSDAPHRLGIYLHSLGDSYSHRTCQQYAAQPISNDVVLVPTNGTPTNHANFDTAGTNCEALPATQSNTREQCHAACALDAHDCEFGNDESPVCADDTTTNALRSASLAGLRKVWDTLASFANRRTAENNTRTVQLWRSSITEGFANNYHGADRQAYVRSWLPTSGETVCSCRNGVYDWIPATTSTDGQGNVVVTAGYCSTLQSMRITADSSGTNTTIPALTVGRTINLFAYGTLVRDSNQQTFSRNLTTEVQWSSNNAAVTIAPNGLLRAVSVGTAVITINRLGVSSTATVVVN